MYIFAVQTKRVVIDRRNKLDAAGSSIPQTSPPSAQGCTRGGLAMSPTGARCYAANLIDISPDIETIPVDIVSISTVRPFLNQSRVSVVQHSTLGELK